MTRNLITPAQNTWCPGCGNLPSSIRSRISLPVLKKTANPSTMWLVTGIGCHAKIADYLNINSVYTLHGRTIPVATGMKLQTRGLPSSVVQATGMRTPRVLTTSSLPQRETSISP